MWGASQRLLGVIGRLRDKGGSGYLYTDTWSGYLWIQFDEQRLFLAGCQLCVFVCYARGRGMFQRPATVYRNRNV